MLRHSGFGVRHEDNDDQQCTYFHSCSLVIMTVFYVQETTDDDLRENRRVGRASFIVYGAVCKTGLQENKQKA